MNRKQLVDQVTYILECAEHEQGDPRPVIRSGVRAIGERLGFEPNQLARFERDFVRQLEFFWRSGVGDVPGAVTDWIREAVNQ